MANILTPLKKFVKMESEKQASILCIIGLLGIIVMSIVEICNILPWQIVADVINGVFIFFFGLGSFLMCYAYRHNTEKGAIPMVWGAFGLIGGLCTMSIIDWCTIKLFGTSIAVIFPWYAIPCLVVFSYGLLRVIAESIKEAWQRA